MKFNTVTVLIAGVCLLALTFTITDAMDKKQDVNECVNLGLAATNCLADFRKDPTSVCSGDCRSTLNDYYDACDSNGRRSFDRACGSAATVGVTLFTIVSAVLVAMGN